MASATQRFTSSLLLGGLLATAGCVADTRTDPQSDDAVADTTEQDVATDPAAPDVDETDTDPPDADEPDTVTESDVVEDVESDTAEPDAREPDVTEDVAGDVTEDVAEDVTEDVAEDAPTDVADDVDTEVTADVTEPDAADDADTAEPDTTDDADTAEDVAGDTTPDVVEPPAPPERSSIDWLAQDYVPGDPSADPYCHPFDREEARISTTLGYLRTDAARDEGGISALAPAYNTERQRWEDRVLTTFDFRPYAESQPGLEGIPNGADIFEAEGQYVSIVGTNDSSGVAGWASSWGDGCQFFDGWISYDRFNVPDFNANDRGSWASVTSPIEGVRNPTRDGCPAGFGSTVTRWTYVSDFTFAAESTCEGDSGRKVMDAIVSDHDGGDHHEVFYFTDEYGGKTRWERWQCGVPYPADDYITDRCQYVEAQSVMHMAYGINDDRRTIVNPNGATCYMTDCRDFTTVAPIASPGYRAAAWHYGAAIYLSSNILRNGDFNQDGAGWDAEGTTAEIAAMPDGNRYLRVSAATTGWHSVLGSSIDEFNRFFDADGADAFRPKYLHWGARVRHAGGDGTARMALVEWGNPGGERIDERGLTLTPEWQWVTFSRLMGPATNRLDVRFRLDGMSGFEVDDVYVYISPDEGF